MKGSPEEREERKQKEKERRNARRNKRPKDEWIKMAAAYTKELLVNVYLYRFRSLDKDKVDRLRILAERHFDDAGRDQFRVSANVTPEAIREYKRASSI